MKEQLDALKEQVAALQTSYEDLSAGSRLSDLEHAVSELNSKAVGGSTAAEETKTQIIENSRKMKELSDLVGQMRDQVDRLRHEVIELQTQQEASPAAPPPAATGSK